MVTPPSPPPPLTQSPEGESLLQPHCENLSGLLEHSKSVNPETSQSPVSPYGASSNLSNAI